MYLSIGPGAFGIVYKAKLSQRQGVSEVAVKTLKGECLFANVFPKFYHMWTFPCYVTGYFNETDIDKIKEESVKMKQFHHPNVMSLVGVCLDGGPAPYIVMPYMAKGSLQSYLKKERNILVLDENAEEDTVWMVA